MHTIEKELKALCRAGDFATRIRCGSDDLLLTVKGVGPIALPVTPTAAKTLCRIAKRAPFGWRDKTISDETVRKTWEIAKSRVKIDTRCWKQTLAPQLEAIKRSLGLDASGTLRAKLHKLLVYEPGDFFAAHQDSEKSDGMVGSLVVVLPSRYTGGSMIVEHGPQRKTFQKSKRPGDLLLIAFYADCRHEVRPVTSGYRIVLHYDLIYDGPEGAACVLPDVDRLTRAIELYFGEPRLPAPYSRKSAGWPEGLIYLLDHEYSQQSLGWERLKSSDQTRVRALAQVAQSLGCEVFLALADVHQTWMCEDDGYDDWRYGRRRYGRYDDDDDDEEEDDDDSADEHALVELIDDDLELKHWIDVEGEAAKFRPSMMPDGDVFTTRESADMNPFKSEHEGYMGNYGNTVDRWYHRAAIVMWPASRGFMVRAKAAPGWAIDQVLGLYKKKLASQAAARIKDLLPFWSMIVFHDPNEWRFAKGRSGKIAAIKTLFTKTLRAARLAADANHAATLLEPFGPHCFRATGLRELVKLVSAYGSEWAEGVFGTWDSKQSWQTPNWSPTLPAACQALCEHGARDHERLAQWLVERQVRSLQARCVSLLQVVGAHGKRPRKELANDFALGLRAAAVTGSQPAAETMVASITDERGPFDLLQLGGLLLEQAKRGSPADTLGMPALYRHVVAKLRGELANPARDANDWSIPDPIGCSCELCETLLDFLRDPAAVELDWKIAAQRRRHVHSIINDSELPVTHVTRRQGSPFTLQLRKRKILFKRSADRRARVELTAKRLASVRAKFV